MNKPDDNIERTLQDWKQGKTSLEQIRNLAVDLGNQHLSAGIPALLRFLDHEDEIVRYHAVMSLGFDLHYKPATNKLLTMLRQDPQGDVRDVAAGALKVLWQNTKDPQVLAGLATTALQDPDEDVRSSAYEALIVVNGVPREERLEIVAGPKLRVDPDRVKNILAGVTE